MRSIHALTLAQLQGVQARIFQLVYKNIGGDEYFFTNCDVPIPYDGDNYLPRRFQVGDIRYSQTYLVDSCRLTIDNLDDQFTPYYVGGDPVIGSTATVYLVALDQYAHIIGDPIILFPGEVDEWSLEEDKVEETLKTRVGRGDVATLKKFSPSCGWTVFKGTECQYAGGETWCDRTYTRCVSLSNTAHFGGFRWLPSIVSKEIWWGRVQK